jgi:D-aminopeptidase
MTSAGSLQPTRATPPHVFEADLQKLGAAELCSLVPGTSRIGARTVRFETDDYMAGYSCLRAWMYLARNADLVL